MKIFNVTEGEGKLIAHLVGDNSSYEKTYDHGKLIFTKEDIQYIIPEANAETIYFKSKDPNTSIRKYDFAEYVNTYRDILPADFNILNIESVIPNSSHFTNEITLEGVNDKVSIIAPQSVKIFVNGTQVTSGTLVDNGDNIKFEMVASESYETKTNYTISIGNMSKTFNITTIVPNGNLETDLLSYWPLKDNTDDVIGGRNLAAYGDGKFEDVKNGAGYYINNGGFLQLDAGSAFHTDEFAISMWVYYKGFIDSDDHPIIMNMEQDWELAVNNGNGPYEWAIYGQPANKWEWVNTELSNYTNQLVHLVYQYNRELSRMEIWVNGDMVYHYDFDRTPGTSCNIFTIGGRECSNVGEASYRSTLKVADVAIWKRNLLQEDIDLILSKSEKGERIIT